MPPVRIVRIGHLKTVDDFRTHVETLGIHLPCDNEILTAPDSPLARPYRFREGIIGNRFAIHPMEGWDAEVDGNPSEYVFRRWRNFGKRRGCAFEDKGKSGVIP